MNEIEQMKEERDSWRRVAERLEREKLDALAKLEMAEKALEQSSEMYIPFDNKETVEVAETFKRIASEALAAIRS